MAKRKNIFGYFGRILFFALVLTVFFAVPASAKPKGSLTIRFLDAYGNACGIGNMTVTEGQNSIKLPKAPADPQAPSGTISGTPSWKLNTKLCGELLGTNKTYTYDKLQAYAASAGNSSVLTLYGSKVVKVTYYYFNGKKILWKRYLYEGTSHVLHDSPSNSNKAYKGWSDVRGGSDVWGGFGKSVVIKRDINLYLVRYPVVRYMNRIGSKVLYEEYYKSGTNAALRPVNEVRDYKALGWALEKNAESPRYQAGGTIKVTKDVTLYAVYRYLTYQVRFTSNDGRSTNKCFTALYRRADYGDSIVMPDVPPLSGKVALGWSTKTGASSAEVKQGASVRVTKDIKYCAVYRDAKVYEVNYVDYDGTTDDTFSAMKRTVYEGVEITLPSVPVKAGYTGTGWKIKMNDKILRYNVGTKMKVQGNYRFYAVYAANAELILHYNDGRDYKKITAIRGSDVTLPGMENPSGYTFMGWSKSKGVTLCLSRPLDNYYEAGEAFPLSGTAHLYAVMLKRSEEGSILIGQLSGSGSPDTSAFKRIILVGDSRTERMKIALDAKVSSVYLKKNVSFICKSGQGLNWFKSEGYNRLITEIDKESTEGKPTAVVFNLGINDINSVSYYISYMKSIAPTLTAKNCRLFYMSLNPVNNVMVQKAGLASRPEEKVRKFNQDIKAGLAGIYTYIDTYSWFRRTGYSTIRGGSVGVDSGEDDGLHYTVNTYKRVYHRILVALAESST